MARATPTKATNELKEKLRREEEKVFETWKKMFYGIFELDILKVLELRAELVTLQKQADERNALHEREVKRAKQASDRTADMYRWSF